MKKNYSVTLKKRISVAFAIAFLFCTNLFAATIANNNFNGATSCPVAGSSTVSNVSCGVTSSQTCVFYNGTTTGSLALTTNSTAGDAIAMANSSGANTKYFEIQMGGTDLNTYSSFQIYFQSMRSATGAQTITVSYSTDGTNFTDYGTTVTVGTTWTQTLFDLSPITALNNHSTVYFRLKASGASGTGTLRVDNLQVAGSANQSSFYFRSVQSGNWNAASSWEASVDNSIWNAATISPNYNANNITIRNGHQISLSATDTIDQTIVEAGATLTYGNNAGSILNINNGSGVDLAINGSFEDIGPNSIAWASSSASWTLGSSATLLRTRGTSSDYWRDHYDNGISNIPATAYWIIRKNSSDSPTLSTVNGMNYPNLIIENNYTSAWNTGTSSSFTGTLDKPIIKGNLDIGGSGSNTVDFLNSNTYSSPVLVKGNLILQSGSTLRSQGTGFEVQGDLTLNGTVDYGTTNAKFVLSGGFNQNISGTLSFKDFGLNKTTTLATITLQSPATVSGTLTFTKGYLITNSTNLLTFAHHSSATGANDSSFIKGAAKKIGNQAFTFPVGKGTNYQYIAMSAPTDTTDAFTAEYFNTGQTLGVATDPTFDYISSCEFFNFDRTNGTSNVIATLGFDMTSCISNMFPDPRVIGWDGTKWKDLGIGAASYTPFGGDIGTDGALTQYGALTLGNNSNSIVLPPDTAFIPSNFRYIKNNGQLLATNDSLRPDIKYYMRDDYPTAYFSDTLLSYVYANFDTIASTPDTLVRVDVQYIGSNNTYPVAQKADSAYTNYYLGHCPNGVVNVPQYQRLDYGNIYKHIDLIYSQNRSGLKYTFNIHPGGEPGAIRAKYTGADSVKIVSGGKLRIYTILGNLTYEAPNAFKIDSLGNSTAVVCNWHIASNIVSFTFPNSYNSKLPLIIMVDKNQALPLSVLASDNLEWSTYLGGNQDDIAIDVDVMLNGSVYVVGTTVSTNFPSNPGTFSGVAQPYFFYGDYRDAFAAKFDKQAKLIWRTYYGGGHVPVPTALYPYPDDGALGIVHDDTGDFVYFTGYTWSSNFPTKSWNSHYYQNYLGGERDAFIVALYAANGNSVWGTYFGGNTKDAAHSIVRDNQGNIFLCGVVKNSEENTPYNPIKVGDNGCLPPNPPTYNSGFPLCNSNGVSYFNPTQSGDYDAFIAKFGVNGGLVWNTFFGGNKGDSFRDIIADPYDNSVYVTGYTQSDIVGNNSTAAPCNAPTNNGFPTCDFGSGYFKNIFPAGYGGQTSFITKFDFQNRLEWSTYFGGQTDNLGCHLAVNSHHELYLTGISQTAGNVLPDIYCGSPSNGGFPLCAPGGAYYRDNYNTTTQLNEDNGLDMYIAKFNVNKDLTWSTFYGGSGNDYNNISGAFPENANAGITIDKNDNVYVLGNSTKASGTPGDVYTYPFSNYYFQNQNNGSGTNRDAFITAFSRTNHLLWATYLGGSGYGSNAIEVGSGIAISDDLKLYVVGSTNDATFPQRCPNGAPNPYCQGTLSNAGSGAVDAFISEFAVPFIVGVEDIKPENNFFSIYPNPSIGNITIAFKISVKMKVIINVYNNIGEIVKIEKFKEVIGGSNYDINLGNLANGIYLVQGIIGDDVISNKIIIQH